MNRDFKTRHELASHVEMRVIPDIGSYSRRIMEIGDVFQSGPVGLYHPHTGECIVDFGRPGYSIDHKTNRILDITCYEDFYRANGAIYNHKGEMTLSHRNLRKVELIDNRPPHISARDAAVSMVADVLYEQFDHSNISVDMLSIKDTLHMDVIDESPRKKDRYLDVRWGIVKDLEKDLIKYSWNEMWMHYVQGIPVIDVQVDIRIKKYYEDLFTEQERVIENDNVCSVFRVQRFGEYSISRNH